MPLDIRDTFIPVLASDNATCAGSVRVSGESDKSLLSWDMSHKLRLLVTVKKVYDVLSLQVLKLKTEYKDIFTSLGKLKGVKLK